MIAGPALLFCPGDRPDRYAKAAAAADTVIIDLEDAVAVPAKPLARSALIASNLDPARTLVRVNPGSTGLLDDDLVALRQTPYYQVMLAKAETAEDLAPLYGFEVTAICESPLGVRNADLLADLDPVVALTWGAEDLVAGIGGRSSRQDDGRYRSFAVYARSRVLIEAASSGKPAFDTVHLDIADVDGLRSEAEDAAASGFSGVLCIHPDQVAVIRSAFRPTAEAIRWAEEVLEAAAGSPGGVFALGRQMVDEPVLRQARRVLDSAARYAPNEGT